MARHELHIQTGKLKGFRLPIDAEGGLTIGRAPSCDLHVREDGVSRLHCRLELREGAAHLVDLGSANGTRVNGELTRGRPLGDGDLLAVGGLVARYCWIADRPDPLDIEEPTIAGSVPPALAALRARRTELTTGEDVELAPTLRRNYEGRAALIHSLTQLQADQGAQRRLAAIYEMSATIFSERGLDAILDQLLSTILAVSGADRGAILLVDSEGVLVPVAQRSADPAHEHDPFRVSRTIVEETLRQGLSQLSSDASIDARFRRGASVLMQQVRSAMCVPVSSRGQVLGAIYADSLSVASVFSETDLELLAAVGQQAGVAVERARLLGDLENLFIGAMLTITASIEAKDAYTRGHSERVTLYALMMADRLGLAPAQRDVLELGGLLHDVGKIGIPEAVLGKPGALTDEEFLLMQQHPELGVRIVSNLPELHRIVDMAEIVAAIRHHHEKFDGSGYPDRRTGEEIPLTARILAVADTYDAITTDRPYRRGCDRSVALRILATYAGSQFDPQLVAVFREIVGGPELPSLAAVRGRFRVTRYQR